MRLLFFLIYVERSLESAQVSHNSIRRTPLPAYVGRGETYGGSAMKVKDMMSKNLISISPDESTDVAARLLSRYNIGALPVCSKDGKLRGMVTDRDIVLRCVAAQEDPQAVKISEIMTRRVVSVDADEPLKTASALMAQQQIRRLPVQQQGKVVGMISLADITRAPNFSAETAQTLNDISQNVHHM